MVLKKVKILTLMKRLKKLWVIFKLKIIWKNELQKGRKYKIRWNRSFPVVSNANIGSKQGILHTLIGEDVVKIKILYVASDFLLRYESSQVLEKCEKKIVDGEFEIWFIRHTC